MVRRSGRPVEEVRREMATAEGPRGVAVAGQEAVSIMVNEEDHLRLQVMRSGFALLRERLGGAGGGFLVPRDVGAQRACP